MVQLEEVEDQELDAAQPGPILDSAYDSADFTDTGLSLSLPPCLRSTFSTLQSLSQIVSITPTNTPTLDSELSDTDSTTSPAQESLTDR